MNTQVQAILQWNDTKTNKIKALLMLGLTRREVADLVTNGNYGFVQNVYKKMQSENAFAAITDALNPFTFNRKFGIEIEAYGVARSSVEQALQRAGINCQQEGYNHHTRPHWKIVSDSSINGRNSFEVVSPILKGEAGLLEVRKVTRILSNLGAQVNKSCGLHVHIDARSFSINTWRKIIKNYATLEPTINAFMPPSRRNNPYSQGLNTISNLSQKLNGARTVQDITDILGTRYMNINAHAYLRHGSIEFRQHSGTTSYDKIEYWIRFLGNLLTYSEQGNEITDNSLNSLQTWNDEDTFTYLKYRTLKIKNDAQA